MVEYSVNPLSSGIARADLLHRMRSLRQAVHDDAVLDDATRGTVADAIARDEAVVASLPGGDLGAIAHAAAQRWHRCRAMSNAAIAGGVAGLAAAWKFGSSAVGLAGVGLAAVGFAVGWGLGSRAAAARDAHTGTLHHWGEMLAWDAVPHTPPPIAAGRADWPPSLGAVEASAGLRQSGWDARAWDQFPMYGTTMSGPGRSGSVSHPEGMVAWNYFQGSGVDTGLSDPELAASLKTLGAAGYRFFTVTYVDDPYPHTGYDPRLSTYIHMVGTPGWRGSQAMWVSSPQHAMVSQEADRAWMVAKAAALSGPKKPDPITAMLQPAATTGPAPAIHVGAAEVDLGGVHVPRVSAPR